jgi:2-keto-4-pentenoate hydratase/2-oxohepta-3-ene-1,7-dioic acid hydratase in catechol pathway
MPARLAPILPDSPAWFVHRDDAGARRLGAFRPPTSADGTPFFDLGPLDGPTAIEAELRAATLSEAALLERIARKGRPLQDPTFVAPVARPSKIACLGKNFAKHAAEFGAEVPEDPLVFTKLADTLCAHGDPIVLPAAPPDDRPGRIDHEAELALVLGFADPADHGRRRIAPDEAWSLVAGVCVANDVTARTLQGHDRKRGWPWLRAKSFETFLPLGPFVVPTGGKPFDLGGRRVQARVDDELRQDADLAEMVVAVPEALAWISRIAPLRCGDIVLMGTPEGVGPLEHGDTVVVTIGGLGGVANPVVRADAVIA